MPKRTAPKTVRSNEPEGDEPRALFVQYLPGREVDKVKADPRLQRRLREDVITVCVKIGGHDWQVSIKDLFASLRHNRWAPIQAKHKWRIPVDEQHAWVALLEGMGFLHDAGTLRPTPALRKDDPVRPKAKAAERPIMVNPTIETDELLYMLAKEKDPNRKKAIRGQLRRMGHRGGLRGDAS